MKVRLFFLFLCLFPGVLHANKSEKRLKKLYHQARVLYGVDNQEVLKLLGYVLRLTKPTHPLHRKALRFKARILAGKEPPKPFWVELCSPHRLAGKIIKGIPLSPQEKLCLKYKKPPKLPASKPAKRSNPKMPRKRPAVR